MNSQRTALITGASYGIGRALAEVFAREGYDLVVVARNEARLHRAAAELQSRYGSSVESIPLDLSVPDSASRLTEALRERGVQITALVNNAGVGAQGPFAELPIQEQLDIIELNVAALTRITHLLLSGINDSGRGEILNVASTAGFRPGPFGAVYCATKAYVVSFTEALAEELVGRGVAVTCLCPGPTHMTEGEGGAHRAWRSLSAAKVAELGFRALKQGRVVAIPGRLNNTIVTALRILPRGAVRRLLRWV